ncbi:MAG TPA: lmo0937 family membrane protein [Ktedonosporobacter sp.]|nr:lmo0937 family membrane protein [Ktedonosporobacter sp.]
MFRVLWAIVVLLVVFWLIGLLGHLAGNLIHILLVVAVIVLLYNLFVGGRSRRRRF